MRKKSIPFVKVRYAPSKKKIDKFLEKYVHEVEDQTSIRFLLAFGSYFTERYTWGSDLDILVVIDGDQHEKEKIYNKLTVDWTPVFLDIFIYTLEEFELMKSNQNPFLKEVLRNGVILIDNLDNLISNV